jgi:hypothetical protein
MTVAPLAIPSSRVLTGWWRQLAPLRPLGLWIGHLLLHRVEALVSLQQSLRTDRLTRLLLQALTLHRPFPSTATNHPLRGLADFLHLSPPMLSQALRQLETEGLIQADEAAGWVLTPVGQAAFEQGDYVRTSHERRVFHFVQGEAPGQAPQFLNLSNAACSPWPDVTDWTFHAGLLEACVRRPREWKERHGFPTEVQEVIGLDQSAGKQGGGSGVRNRGSLNAAWRRVILDQPGRLPAALVLVPTESGGEQLVGYAVRLDGWVLQAAQPVFNLGSDWRDVFPDLAEETPAEQWHPAWRAWCQPRGVPGPDIDKCTFQRHQCRLVVTAPTRLVQRLRSAKSDVFKGEAWLLADRGRIRPAAVVELVEAKKS